MKLRDVQYADEAACIADIDRLRRGYRRGGGWTLEQVCWHVNYPLERATPDTGAPPTAEQQKAQGFIDQVFASGWPVGISAATVMIPPEDARPEAVDACIASLRRLQAVREPRVNALMFGPVDTARLRRFVLIHAAHHLSFLEPRAR